MHTMIRNVVRRTLNMGILCLENRPKVLSTGSSPSCFMCSEAITVTPASVNPLHDGQSSNRFARNFVRFLGSKNICGHKNNSSSLRQCHSFVDSGNGIPSIKDIRIQKYLDHVLEMYIAAQTKLVSGKVNSEVERQKVNKTLKEMKMLVAPLQEYFGKEQEIADLKQMAEELGKEDPEIQDAATKETEQINQELKTLEKEILFRMVPVELVDNNDIILELSAGVGGNEAFLFTSELFDMYQSYAAVKGWNFTIIDNVPFDSGHGGTRKAAAMISGHDVYKNLKYEAGVHRVQRVPKTEKHGRIHTSTATVAIMPEATEIDIKIDPKDLKIDTFRSSGPGGQHVNTTESAVRVKHIPTGISAECQKDRSQIKNKATAMKVLMSRIYQQELETQQSEQNRTRKLQIGTAGRSEKIRTYNFKQDRITDHRVGENLFDLETFLAGGQNLDELIQMLQLEAWKEKLLEIITEYENNSSETRAKR